MRQVSADRKIDTQYDSYTEFLALAEQGPHFRKFADGNGGMDNHWFGDDGWQHSRKLAHEGWTEGRQAVAALVDSLNITGKLYKQTVAYDVVGDGGFDMGRVMLGEPECMMVWEDTDQQQDAHNGPIVRLVVDVTSSSGIRTAAIRMRGAAVLALCDALEHTGKRLEIDAIWYCGNRRQQLTIPLKRADTSAQPDQIAYALAHPAFPRRYCHFVLGSSGPTSQDPKTLGADVYCPPLHLDYTQWTDRATVMTWINDTLKGFGISIEGQA